MGFIGSQKAAFAAAGREGMGGDLWGIPLAAGVGLWWWVRGTPAAPDEDEAAGRDS